MTTIVLLPHQKNFIFSTATHTGLVAGFGSGKSIASTIKTIFKHTQQYGDRVGIDCAYYLPTYPLIRDIAFPNFRKYLDLFGIQYTINTTDKEIKTDYGKILFRSLDNPDLIVGYEVGYSVVDEADLLRKDKMQNVFIKALGRNRQIEDAQLDFVSTPEGYGFMYDFFYTNINVGSRKLIKAKTTDNKYLPKSYIDNLLLSYDKDRIEAYMNGEFVNFNTGNVYKFNRQINSTDREADDRSVLHIGMDFNITNMSAVVHLVENNLKFAVDEFTQIYDTQSMVDAIKERYPTNHITIYPDASGGSRKTSASYTDIQILQRAGFRVRVGASNPPVRDRVNEMNLNFIQHKYFVNIKKCPTFVSALEQLGYKGGEPDKTSGLDHITECGGYFLWGQRSNVISMR